MANLAGLLRDTARTHGTGTALLHDGERIDYLALEALAARFAGLFLARGVETGDRVAVVLPNEPDFIGAYFGALWAGAIVVPLNPLLRRAEVESRLANAEARLLVAPAERAEELGGLGAELVDPRDAAAAEPAGDLVARDPDDLSVLLYTSGTSGSAKGAELTHGGLGDNAFFLGREILGLTTDSVLLGSTPLSHVLGQSGVMNASIACGSCVALMPRFDVEGALELMRTERAGVFLGVPTMCKTLLQATEGLDDVPQLQMAHIGGAPLPPETLRAFAERFRCPLLEGYGMTETGTVSSNRLGHERPGSVGTPAAALEVKVDAPAGEVGEVHVRGGWLMRGYWRNPEETSAVIDADGWFATGDVGYLDEDGYLYLVDRMKDLILRGGYSVYPREVEDVLHDHPAVQEAAVVGVPHETLGEEVVALVVLRPGAECDPDEVKAFVRERVAAYKYPRLVVVVERLPRGPTGKLLKREIDREPLRAALA